GVGQIVVLRREDDGQQEAEEDLHAHLGDADLLDQLDPHPVRSLVLGLVAPSAPDLALLRVGHAASRCLGPAFPSGSPSTSAFPAPPATGLAAGGGVTRTATTPRPGGCGAMSDTQLTVTLSGGGVDDARAVVRVLEGTFGASDGLPSDDRATVRTATFGAGGHGGRRAGGGRAGGGGGHAGRGAPGGRHPRGGVRRPRRRGVGRRPGAGTAAAPGAVSVRPYQRDSTWSRMRRASRSSIASSVCRDSSGRRAAAALARACSGERAPGMTVVTPGRPAIQRSASWAGV